MASFKRTEIGFRAAKTMLCLVTLLTAMPALAKPSSPVTQARASCFSGGKATPDQIIAGCTAVIAAKGTKPKDLAGAYLNRGANYLAKNDSDRAIADFSELIRLKPKLAGAYTNRGEAWRRKGEVNRAIADLDRAIALDPKGSFAWFNRGITYSDKGEPEKAIADYNQAIRLNSIDPWYFNNRANSYGDINEFSRAMNDYDHAIRLDPKFALAYFNRGTAFRNHGNEARALADLNISIRLDPNYAAAYGNRARLFRDKGEIERALADFDHSLRLAPSEYRDAYARGNIHFDRRDFPRALSDYDHALQWNSKYAAALNARCLTRAIVGRAQEGLADCEESLRHRPGDAPTLDSRAFCHLKLGEFDAAIDGFTVALGADPRLANSLYGRGIAKRKKGDESGAQSDIAAARAIKADIADEFRAYGIE